MTVGRLVPDVLVSTIFVAAAFVVEWEYLIQGNYLPLAWGDWVHHAYRTRFIQEHGLATWSHDWSGGMSLFQTYQFVPHVLTAWVAKAVDASAGRTMLALEGVLLIWIRVSGYVAARTFRLPVAAAVFAGVITFGINNYAAEILSYASLWAVALAPVLLVLIFWYAERPAIYILAAAVGFGIYVHPHLALVGVLLLLAAFCVSQPSRPRAFRLLAQLGIVVLASAFFWVPAVLSSQPPMQDPTAADPAFMRTIFDGSVDLFSGLLWLLIPLCTVGLAFSWTHVRKALFSHVAIYVALMLFLIGVSYAGVGPETLRLTQSVRLLGFLPLGLALLVGLVVDAGLKTAPLEVQWRRVAPLAAGIVAAVLFVPLFRFAEDLVYQPTELGADPIHQWLRENGDSVQGRIWMGDLETALYSYRNFEEFRQVMNHFTSGDWSLLARPLQEGVLVGDPGWETVEAYMRAMGVSYLLVAENTAASLALGPGGAPAGQYDEALRLETFPELTLYQTPWEPVVGFVADADELPELDFPETRYQDEADRAMRDSLTEEYAAFAYSDEARPVSVDYPSPTGIRVDIENLVGGEQLVVAENWDRSWNAETSEGQSLAVERYGPNYLLVDVSELRDGVTVELRHGMSYDWKIGIALTLLSVPVAAGLLFWERRGGLDKAGRRA